MISIERQKIHFLFQKTCDFVIFTETMNEKGQNQKKVKGTVHNATKIYAVAGIFVTAGFIYLLPSSLRDSVGQGQGLLRAYVLMNAALAPVLLLMMDGLKTDLVNSLLITLIWSVWMTILLSPMYLLVGKWILLGVYLPLGLIFSKKPHTPCPWFYLTLQTLTWDWPLLNWMYLCNILGKRGLGPFLSEIDEDIYIGSLPFNSDVAAMSAPLSNSSRDGSEDRDNMSGDTTPWVQSKPGYNIGAVVNMCRETCGPQKAYEKAGIIQYRSHTPDINEPAYSDVLDAVGFIRTFIRSQEAKQQKSRGAQAAPTNGSKKKVLIHCKAGRGRSACIALCYYLSTGLNIQDAFAKIRAKRAGGCSCERCDIALSHP